MASSSQIALSGRIVRITYHNQDNHFTIARLKTDESQRGITIKGTMPTPRVGESVEVQGDWESHPRFGQQFNFSNYSELLPATVDGIRHYLASGFIKGVGPKLVDRVITHFKADTLSVIETAPERLTEVRGIGEKTAQHISDAWKSHHAARKLLDFLGRIGVDAAYAARLLQTYGNDVIDTMINEPYRLAEDLPGVGFRIADAVVQHMETPVDENDRARACVRHLLEQAVDNGHTYTVQDRLLDRCQKEFELQPETAAAGLAYLVQEGSIVTTTAPGTGISLVFPKSLHEAETIIARRIAALQSVSMGDTTPSQRSIAQDLLSQLAVTLSAEQEKVVHSVLEHKVSVITGGPGTGKTTLIRTITTVMQSMGRRVVLMAPTGRAARRLAEVTGVQAVTLHRALGYHLADGRFERTEDDQLQVDTVIVDEASMVDTLLMMQLLRAIPITAALVLVGDVFQLPSVGPGNVLRDLIQSRAIQTFEVKENFRQNEQGLIVANAHRVRTGSAPQMAPMDDEDIASEFYFMERANQDQVVETVVQLCHNEIPTHFRKEGDHKLDPIRDIQVLTPMHRGPVGTLNLNRRLQKTLNPMGDEVAVLGSRFRVGDKVMNQRNDYRKEVFNGDIGILNSIDKQKERVEVEYDGRIVLYNFVEMDTLALAYAISVHKSQGSEYPVVVVPLVTQHYVMLQRNLLYTAITRGKELVVLVGSPKALRVALENNRPRERRTMLAYQLNPGRALMETEGRPETAED